MMNDQVMLQNGMDVYGADGEKLGSIHEVRANYFVVEKGFFFPKDYYIPLSAAEGVDPDNRVYLNVTKDAALNQGWDAQPEDHYTAENTYPTTGQATGAAAGSGAGMAAGTAAGSTYESVSKSQSAVIDPNFVAATDTPASGSEATRVPVYEEEITPIKRSVDRGAVRIEKELVTEERTITVPVTEERVRITQVDTNESVPTGAGDLFQDDVIEVPLHGEEVDLQKSARKTGEVIVEKEAVQHDEQVSGSVRREEVHVDDTSIQSTDASNRKPS
jgi:uncharacterized protein (TIGR02271 family)